MHDWKSLIRARLDTANAGAPAPLNISAHEREAIDEIAEHLDDVYQRGLTSGASHDEALKAAETELDGMGPLTDALARRANQRMAPRSRSSFASGLLSDIRQAARLIRLRPGFAAIVGLTLAVGIGASTAVFSVYDAVLVKALPFADPSQLVLLWEADQKNRTPAGSFIVSAPNYEDWRAQNRTLASLGIWEYLRFNISAGAEPEQVPAARVSASAFDTLGVKPALGRTFTSEEDAPGHHVAIISDGVWRAHFAADRSAIGQTIRINDEPHTVVGVMPANFYFPRATNGVWVPIAFTAQDHERDSHSFYVVGRMKPGVTLAQVDEDFARIGKDLAAKYRENDDESAMATPLADYGVQNIRQMLTALGGAVLLVMLIACVNVANLQIGLAMTRRREFVVRQALGAGVARIARQLFAEGAAFAVLGGIGGLFFALVIAQTLGRMLGDDFLTFAFRGRVQVSINDHALAFAAAAALGGALLFSFAPLMGLRRSALSAVMQSGSRVVTRSAAGLRQMFVAAEIAMAIVVLCGAGLLIKSLANLLSVPPGLNPDRVIGMQVSLPQPDTYGPPVRANFCEDVANTAASAPFASIGAISHLPLSGANAGRGLSVEGWQPPEPNAAPSAAYRIICPGYFNTLSIPIISGRDISAQDRIPVVVVNRVFAERYWPKQNPLGKRLKIGSDANTAWMTVVGVAENVKHFGLDTEARREIFVPYRQNVWPVMSLVARTNGDVTPAHELALRDVIRKSYPGVPGGQVWTMNSVIGDSVGARASFMRMLLVFAGIGLVLSAIGVYSVLAYYVSQRLREIGVRVALGASRSAIVALVLRHSFIPMTIGLVIGIVGSLWTGRLLTTMLFRTAPGDVVVLSSISALVIAVSLAASWIPAHRAAGVDPTVTLRD